MEKKYIDVYQKCIDVWGWDAQIKMCIEEMSELTKELCKFYRAGEMSSSEELKNHIREEIADTLNMAEQMQFLFGAEEVDKIRDYKIERTRKILDEEQKN